jgi:hypothetical protein
MLIYEASIKYIAGINRTRALSSQSGQQKKPFLSSLFSPSIGHFFNKNFFGVAGARSLRLLFFHSFSGEHERQAEKKFFVIIFIGWAKEMQI